jgi:hypothetical protein
MPLASDCLLRDGLAALAQLLPQGYSMVKSGLNKRDVPADAWLVIRNPAKRSITCLVLARRRVETRDLGILAASVAKAPNPALLLSTYLAPAVKERLRGFGIGFVDLTGNALIEWKDIGLSLHRESAAGAGAGNERAVRSLCGEMAGRVARVLIDLRPPYSLGELADLARVESSYASRVVSFLASAQLVQRQPRAKIEEAAWLEILRRWSLDTSLPMRGELFKFTCARGIPDYLSRLASSGFLHALTGEVALARLAATALPATAVTYVEEVDAAVDQFFLHPAGEDANCILVKPADRSVFHRSSEAKGLRYVSPSLMAADLGAHADFELALTWMSQNEAVWRVPGARSL